jgi:predicted nucleic acid-binding Zn finger protein
VTVVVVFDTYYFIVCGWTSCASLVTFSSQQQGVLDASYLLNGLLKKNSSKMKNKFTKVNMMQLQTNKVTTRIY